MTIKPGMNSTNEKAYQTEITYTCPSNTSSVEMMYFAFNYTSLSLVKSVKMVCEIDGQWSVNSSLAEESCGFNKSRCETPVLPVCIDQASYCSKPPPIPLAGTKTFINRPSVKETFPKTSIHYQCPKRYFDIKNESIASIVISCHEGKWTTIPKVSIESSNPVNVSICSESEKGANGSDIRRCEEVIIPDCVDKTVQCSNPPTSIKGATIQKLETFQTKTSSWCGEKAKYIGKVHEEVELSSFLDCQTLCQNSSDCNFVSFDAVNNSCTMLKDRNMEWSYFDENTISGPKECSPTCSWTSWMSSNTNGRRGDDERLKTLIETFGSSVCLNPESIEVRSRQTWQMVMNISYPQTYSYFDNTSGFYCLNTKQKEAENCHDYEIRLCCPPAPEIGSQIELSCVEDSHYFKFKDQGFVNKITSTCHPDGTWKHDSFTAELCPDGSKNCLYPDYPSCQDRTVHCLDELNIPSDMKRIRIKSNDTADDTKLGTTYLYSCVNDDFLINTDGYPEAIEVECIEPENYQNTWTYNLWKEGQWENQNLLKGCMDPDLCYSSPPIIPEDNSVKSNMSKTYDALPIEATIEYSCSEQCKEM